MDYGDGYDEWMETPFGPDYATMLSEVLGSLELSAPITIRPDASATEAIDLMNQYRVGCVVVTADQQVQGVFTERDVLTRVATQKIDTDRTAISDLMTPAPECLNLGDTMLQAINTMIVGGFRHLPVVDQGKPVGVFGMRDFVRYIVELHPDSELDVPPPGLPNPVPNE